VSANTRDWLLRVIVCSAVAALVAAGLADPLTEATTPGNGPRLQQIVVFVLTLGVVGMVYVGVAWMLRIPEMTGIFDQLSRRVPPLRRLASLVRH
jgi:spore maturation protein SpmA